MRIASSGEVLVIGAELLVDVEAVDVGQSMVYTRVNSNHPQLGEIPTLWQLVKSIAINTHIVSPVVLVMHNKPLQSSVNNISSDMKVSV